MPVAVLVESLAGGGEGAGGVGQDPVHPGGGGVQVGAGAQVKVGAGAGVSLCLPPGRSPGVDSRVLRVGTPRPPAHHSNLSKKSCKESADC